MLFCLSLDLSKPLASSVNWGTIYYFKELWQLHIMAWLKCLAHSLAHSGCIISGFYCFGDDGGGDSNFTTNGEELCLAAHAFQCQIWLDADVSADCFQGPHPRGPEPWATGRQLPSLWCSGDLTEPLPSQLWGFAALCWPPTSKDALRDRFSKYFGLDREERGA